MSRLPEFIIIGGMKCATTTLHEQLAGQPGIFMWGPGEIEFFSDDEKWARGLDWYRSEFSGAGKAVLCGERSTEYTKRPTYPHTVERIQRTIPDARLIYVIRHPIERAVSHYSHEWLQRRISEPIESAVSAGSEFVEYSRYALQLEPYIEAFGRERILLVGFERLVTESQLELERICEFLGYPSRPRWDERRGKRNVSSERLRASPLRDRLLHQPLLASIRRRLVPKSFRDRVKRIWQMRRTPQLMQRQTAALSREFDEDLRILGSWLDLELSCANFKETVALEPLNWVVGKSGQS